MKVLFMGTPEFAVPTLKALAAEHEVVAVVTQPDKPKGRGNKMQSPPVKEFAVEWGIEVLQPERIKKAVDILKKYPADVFVVVAYGQLLSEEILSLPKHGCLNVHGSLLPKYRGAAPIQWAVINGEAETGITIMQMDKGLDTGDMLLKKSIPILLEDTARSLHDKMSQLGADALMEVLGSIGNIKPEKQDDSQACYASMLNKEIGRINWNKNSNEILNLIRGLNPWPVAYAYYNSEILKIWEAEAVEGYESGNAGQIVDILPKKGIVVKAGDGAILVKQIQSVGGKRMSVTDYLRGHSIEKYLILQ